MKYILLAFIIFPFLTMAQQAEKIDLSQYGLKASLTNNGVSTVKEIEKGESDFKTLEVKVRFDNSNRLTITELKSPLSVPVYIKATKQALATKNKSVTLKALVNKGNAILVERTYKEDGRKIYKCMYGVIAKGKHYLIDSDEIDDEETARKLLAVAQSFSMN